MRRTALAILLAAVCSAWGFSAAAQSIDRATVQQQAEESFNQRDFTKAAAIIESYLTHAPNDASMLYNLACARCRLNQMDAAADALHRAFRAGFDDFAHMRRDPDLAAMRDHPVYKKIIEEAERPSALSAANAMEQWRQTHSDEDYRYETDNTRHINYATALDATSHREMREMLEKEADQAIKSLFGKAPNYFVLIAVPTPDDGNKFFNNDQSIGGMYQHNLRRLVSRDIGGTLRHEFLHALHYGHMERLGQSHALWIQEGMACLYEDYEFADDGHIRFLPNDRQILVKARAKSGKLVKWSELFSISSKGFMDKAQQMYPAVRSIFEYLAANGLLESWYQNYTDHFDEDRTGSKAFELTFKKPVEEIERDWRRWVIKQPEVNLRMRADSPALGIQTANRAGSNDGVLITNAFPSSGAARAGLRKGDVIVAIEGNSTRTLTELRKAIASYQPGESVQVRARRDGKYFTVPVVLRAMGGE